MKSDKHGDPQALMDKVDEMVKRAMASEVPPEVTQRLDQHLIAFQGQLKARERTAKQLFWGRAVLRYAAAMTVAAILMWLVNITVDGLNRPTWAEVVKRFDSVPYINATIYVKSSALAEPVQLELWMQQGGLLRLRAGNEMVFSKKGQVIERVPFAPPPTTSDALRHAQDLVQPIIESLGAAESFSFDTFVHALPPTVKFTVPLCNMNVSTSNDLVVFDMMSDDDAEWMRIWALSESRLPMRVLYWSAYNGASVDASLSYANQQPPSCFDPEAYKKCLAEGQVADHAYGLLQDPGGRAITPLDMERLRNQAAHPENQTPDASPGSPSVPATS